MEVRKMEWEGILVIVVILWAIVHSYADWKVSKRVEKLEKELQAHKH